MTLAKLFIVGQEIEVLSCDMNYYRDINRNGKPATEIMGGLITVCYATNQYSDLVLRWMTKESEDITWNEPDKMEKGKVCFYENGFDYPPTKTYKFNDAHLIYFKETFNAEGEEPMQTILTISPAIQNYGVEFVKLWNESWIPPSERAPYKPIDNNDESKLIEYHFENEKGNRIDKSEINIGDTIYLMISTKNAIGKSLQINLDDNYKDFEHNGNAVINDVLNNIIIEDDICKIQLKAVKQKEE